MSADGVVYRRAVDVHRRLVAAGIGNEIGGALALAYYVDDPRGTQDIDVNIALPKSEAVLALGALPEDVPWDDAALAAIERDGQVRLWWPIEGELPMPLDLFFAEHELHAVAHARAVAVPMAGAVLSILSATDLTVFKSLFDRPKDWVDIQAMLDAHDSSVDLEEAAAWVGRIVGESDPRVSRLRSMSRSTL